MFEAFALRKNKPLSAKDIERFTGVAWATVHRRLSDWTKSGLLDQVGKDGKAVLYQLNTDSRSVRALSKAVHTAVVELLETDLLDEGVAESDLEMAQPVELADLKDLTTKELFCDTSGQIHGFDVPRTLPRHRPHIAYNARFLPPADAAA